MWLLLVVFFSCFLIPPINQHIIAPILSHLLLSLVIGSYVQLHIWFNVFTGTLGLKHIVFQKKLLQYLQYLISLPLDFQSGKCGDIRITFSWWNFFASGGTQPIVKVSITKVILHAKCIGKCEWTTQRSIDLNVHYINEEKNVMVEMVTVLLEEILAAETSKSSPRPYHWYHRWLDLILDYLQIHLNQVQLIIDPVEQYTSVSEVQKHHHVANGGKYDVKANSDSHTRCIVLSWSSLCMFSLPNKAMCTRRFDLRDLKLKSCGENMLSLPLLTMDVLVPPILRVLLSPEPLKEKQIKILSYVGKISVETKSDSVHLLNHVVNIFINYYAFLQWLSNESMEHYEVPTEQSIEQYQKLYQKQLTRENQAKLDVFEKKWASNDILNARMISLQWETKLESIGVAGINSASKVIAYFDQISNERGVFRYLNVTISLHELELLASDATDTIATILLHDVEFDFGMVLVVDGQKDNHLKDICPYSMNLSVHHISCWIEYPMLGAARSLFVQDNTSTTTFNLAYFLNWDGKQVIESCLESVRFIVFAKPIEYLMQHLDHMVSIFSLESSDMTMLDYSDSAVVSPTSLNDGRGIDHPVPLLFGNQHLEVVLNIVGCGICLGTISSQSVITIAHMLELATSINITISSSSEKESVLLNISNISLIPKILDYSDEKAVEVLKTSGEDSLIDPLKISGKYLCEVKKENEGYKADQSLLLQIPDIVIAFSHSNLAILISSLTGLASIQMSKSVVQQTRDYNQKLLKTIEKEGALKESIDMFQKTFDEICTDDSSSIGMNELEALIASTPNGRGLLKSEIKTLAIDIFDTIDENKDGVIELMEFENLILNDGMGFQLRGYLNLKCGEYKFFDRVPELFGDVVQSEEELFVIEAAKAKFWSIYEEETGANRFTIGNQTLDMAQKKLVRLLQNFDLAEKYWNRIISPSLLTLDNNATIIKYYPWILNENDVCGGLAELQTLSSMVQLTPNKTSDENVFVGSELILPNNNGEDSLSKMKTVQITLHSDLQLGNLRLLLVDPILPAGTYRCEILVSGVKSFAKVDSKVDPDRKDNDHFFFQESSSWTFTLGFKLQGWCYSDLADMMEMLIEPWNLAGALFTNKGEEGYSFLIEASQRLQLNVTTSVIQLMQLIFDIIEGKPSDDVNDHQRALMHSNDDELGLHLTNCTGVALHISVTSDLHAINTAEGNLIPSECSAFFPGLNGDDLGHLYSGNLKIEIPGWGSAIVSMDSLTHTNEVQVQQDCYSAELEIMPYIPIFCSRLPIPKKGFSIILRGNLSVINHCCVPVSISVSYHSHLIELDDKDAKKPWNVNLCPGEIHELPLKLYTSNADIVVREMDVSSRVIAKRFLSLDPDLLQVSNSNRIGDDTNQSTELSSASSPVFSMLSPDVHLNSKVADNILKFDILILPKFIIRNALPYDMEYAFQEVDMNEFKKLKLDTFDKIRSFITIESAQTQQGVIHSGNDIEIPLLSKSLAYICFRLRCPSSSATSKNVTSPWTPAILLPISGDLSKFEAASETIYFGDESQFKSGAMNSAQLDKLSLPGMPRVVKLSVPYWIINNTGIEMEYCSADIKMIKQKTMMNTMNSPAFFKNIHTTSARKVKSNDHRIHHSDSIQEQDQFNQPVMIHLENDRISIRPKHNALLCGDDKPHPKAWSSIKNPVIAELPDNAIEMISWSETVNASAINTVGPIHCGICTFSIAIQGMNGIFNGTKVIKLGPRYIVQNQTPFSIRFQSFAAKTADARNYVEDFKKKSNKLSPSRLSPRKITVRPPLTTTTLERNESGILHSIEPLKISSSKPSLPLQQKQLTENLQKYLILSHANHTSKETSKQLKVWSRAIPIDSAGDFYCHITNMKNNRLYLLKVSVQVTNGGNIFIIVQDSSETPPYRIENYTGANLSYTCRGDSVQYEIPCGKWNSFMWYDPHHTDHQVQIVLADQSDSSSKTTFDIDHIGYHKSLKLGKQEIVVQVSPNGGTRVLQFMERQAFETRLNSEKKQVDELKYYFASNYTIRLAGLGISLFDSIPREVLFLSVDIVSYVKPSGSFEWELEVFHLQIDNMLKRQKFPVLLEPIGSGHSSNTLGSDSTVASPCFQLKVNALLGSKQSIQMFEHIEIRLSPMSIKIDIDFVIYFLSLFAQNIKAEQASVLSSTTDVAHALVYQALALPDAHDDERAAVQTQLLYFEVFRIHATSLELEWILRRSNIDRSSSYLAVELIMHVLSIVGSNLSGTPTLRFNELVISQCFTSQRILLDRVTQSYKRQAIYQTYRVLGSMDILGDPIGLVENLGSGVAEFFRITKGEVLGDVGTRGEGFKVLGKTIAKAGATSASKITGSLDRFVGDFMTTNDDDTPTLTSSSHASLSTTLSNSKDNEDSSLGSILDGGLQFAKHFGRELGGIVTKPIDGARKHGVSGFVQGTANGLLGPAAVCLKAVTAATHSVAQGVEAKMINRAPFEGRRRLPKACLNPTTVVEVLPSLVKFTIVGAKGLQLSSSSSGSCDPSCTLYVDGKKVFRTKTLHNAVNPRWLESKSIALKGTEKLFTLTVKDSHGPLESVVGSVTFSMAKLLSEFRFAQEAQTPLIRMVETGEFRKSDLNLTNVNQDPPVKEYPLLMKSTRTGAAVVHSSETMIVVTIVEATELSSLSSPTTTGSSLSLYFPHGMSRSGKPLPNNGDDDDDGCEVYCELWLEARTEEPEHTSSSSTTSSSSIVIGRKPRRQRTSTILANIKSHPTKWNESFRFSTPEEEVELKLTLRQKGTHHRMMMDRSEHVLGEAQWRLTREEIRVIKNDPLGIVTWIPLCHDDESVGKIQVRIQQENATRSSSALPRSMGRLLLQADIL